MTGLRLKLGLTVRALPEGDAVVAGGDEMDAVIVNSSAHAILDLLSDVRTEEEIADLFVETFPDQDPSSVRRDIAELVSQLMRAGIVEACGTAPSTASG